VSPGGFVELNSTVSIATVFEKSGFISKGIWFTTVSELGPFTDAGAPAGRTTITASMRTAGFDPAVTSSTDDPFRIAIDPTSDGFGNPSAHSAGSGRNHPGDDHASRQEGQRSPRPPESRHSVHLADRAADRASFLHDRCGDQHAAVHLHDRLVGSLDLAGSTNGCVPPPRQSRAHRAEPARSPLLETVEWRESVAVPDTGRSSALGHSRPIVSHHHD
jgi:hypothetical protein